MRPISRWDPYCFHVLPRVVGPTHSLPGRGPLLQDENVKDPRPDRRYEQTRSWGSRFTHLELTGITGVLCRPRLSQKPVAPKYLLVFWCSKQTTHSGRNDKTKQNKISKLTKSRGPFPVINVSFVLSTRPVETCPSERNPGGTRGTRDLGEVGGNLESPVSQ